MLNLYVLKLSEKILHFKRTKILWAMFLEVPLNKFRKYLIVVKFLKSSLFLLSKESEKNLFENSNQTFSSF